MIVHIQEQSYSTAIHCGSRAFQYVTNAVMQTTIRVNHSLYVYLLDHLLFPCRPGMATSIPHSSQ